MRLLPLLFLLPLLASATAGEAPAPMALTPQQQTRHADAEQAFRAQRFSAAYGRFAWLADAGHAPSARLALVMHEQGEQLFGSAWAATTDQKRRWRRLAQQAPTGASDTGAGE